MPSKQTSNSEEGVYHGVATRASLVIFQLGGELASCDCRYGVAYLPMTCVAYLEEARQAVLDAVAHLPQEILGVEIDDGQVFAFHGLDPLVCLGKKHLPEKQADFDLWARRFQYRRQNQPVASRASISG